MATSLDLFAYLAAFVSVVLALAVSDWLQSFHRLIRARTRVRWSLVAVLAAFLVFLAILEEFFGLWRLAGLERFTYLDLLAVIVPAILLSMAAMTVLPDEVPETGMDLVAHYLENRRLLYLLLSLWVFGVFLRLADLFERVSGKPASALEMAAMFPWQTLPLLLLFGVMMWSRDMRVQLVGVVLSLLLVNSAMINRTIEVARPG
jgi:hypothetical protein